jgi:hypothetical protein
LFSGEAFHGTPLHVLFSDEAFHGTPLQLYSHITFNF